MRKILALALVASFAALVACNKTEEAKPAVDTAAVVDTAKKDTVKADTAKADTAKKAEAKK